MSRDDIVQELDKLPPRKLEVVMDFIEFLKLDDPPTTRRRTAFYEWAANSAREGCFDNLTEEDVARLVHETRSDGGHISICHLRSLQLPLLSAEKTVHLYSSFARDSASLPSGGCLTEPPSYSFTVANVWNIAYGKIFVH